MSFEFAVRDDDTAFFTSPGELENAYSFMKDGCISLSVVPYTVARHTDTSMPYGDRSPDGYHALGDNAALVAYLKEKTSSGRYDILLHGYSHEYQPKDGKWYPEMIWKDAERLAGEVREGKNYLEKLLDTSISVFSAPSNEIDRKGIAALEDNNLNLCGLIYGIRSRRMSFSTLRHFTKRWAVRLKDGIQYPGLMDYGKHRELNAYPLNDDRLMDIEYDYCKEHATPFVIYTHYWKLNRNEEEKRRLLRLYERLCHDGARCVSVSSLLSRQ